MSPSPVCPSPPEPSRVFIGACVSSSVCRATIITCTNYLRKRAANPSDIVRTNRPMASRLTFGGSGMPSDPIT